MKAADLSLFQPDMMKWYLQAANSEFETSIRQARQLEGISLANTRGVQFGRKAKLTSDQIAELRIKRKSGVLIKDLMAEYELSKASVYRLMNAS